MAKIELQDDLRGPMEKLASQRGCTVEVALDRIIRMGISRHNATKTYANKQAEKKAAPKTVAPKKAAPKKAAPKKAAPKKAAPKKVAPKKAASKKKPAMTAAAPDALGVLVDGLNQLPE